MNHLLHLERFFNKTIEELSRCIRRPPRFVEGAHENDRKKRVVPADEARKIKTGKLGEIDVTDHQVEWAREKGIDSFFPRTNYRYVISDFSQGIGKRPADEDLIINNEDLEM